jgi:hypothetical protein
MSIGRQIETIKIGAGVLNTSETWVPWTIYASGVDFAAFNATFSVQTEFLGSSKIQTLSGYEKQGIMGYRPYVTIDLRNTTSAETQKIQTLLGHAGTWGATARPPFPDANLPGNVAPPRDTPTVFAISTNGNVANYQYFNLESGVINVARELTINSQIITLSFSGINVLTTIPNGFIV